VDGGECLIEVLARGEPIGSEFGFARELLLGIDQIRVGRFGCNRTSCNGERCAAAAEIASLSPFAAMLPGVKYCVL
jgi:hypothetical protein